MKNSTIHIRLEYEEAVASKKDILSSEMNLLRIARELGKYKALRKKELELKLNLSKKIKETRASLNKLHRELPKVELPKILQEHQAKTEPIANKVEKKIEKTKEKQKSDDLEIELQDIQDRLDMLE